MRKEVLKTDTEIEQFGKAIGNRTRARILRSLSGGPKPVQSIVEAVGPMSQPAVSQHLRTLRNAQLVSSKHVGKEVHNSFNPKQYNRMLHALALSIKRS
jgi:DNA-binding transcriptional ArsR family regulator